MPSDRPYQRVLLSAFLALAAGCGSARPVAARAPILEADTSGGPAEISVLYVGNSHTSMHDLPTLVGEMIRFRRQATTVHSRVVPVGFLEDAARDPLCREALESRAWTFVVLQAQKE